MSMVRPAERQGRYGADAPYLPTYLVSATEPER
jgi:hypothetical protein